MTTDRTNASEPLALKSNEWLGAASETRCWCHACNRPTAWPFSLKMIVCPDCGDKRCVHAVDHEAPCAKTDIYAHNSWVERNMRRQRLTPVGAGDGNTYVVS